jgi:hypothetical protein
VIIESKELSFLEISSTTTSVVEERSRSVVVTDLGVEGDGVDDAEGGGEHVAHLVAAGEPELRGQR